MVDGHLREQEVQVLECAVRPVHRAAPVELPVPEGERDDVGGPDGGPGGQQGARGAARVPGDDLVDQQHRRRGVGPADEQDQHDADPAHEHAPALDAHRVGDGQGDQHATLEDGQQPHRQRPHGQLVGQQPLQHDRDDHADGDRPARLTPGPAPPGRHGLLHVVEGLVLGVLGPGHQGVPDRVTDPAGVRRAEHAVAAHGARRVLARGGPVRGTACWRLWLHLPIVDLLRPCLGVRYRSITQGPALTAR